MAATVAAIAMSVRGRRALIDHFCAAHAITPYDTILYKPPATLQRAFETMVAERLIRREGHAYYWLDLNALDAQAVRRRRKLVPVTIAICVVLALVVTAFYQG